MKDCESLRVKPSQSIPKPPGGNNYLPPNAEFCVPLPHLNLQFHKMEMPHPLIMSLTMAMEYHSIDHGSHPKITSISLCNFVTFSSFYECEIKPASS